MVRRKLIHRHHGAAKPAIWIGLIAILAIGGIVFWWINRDPSNTPDNKPLTAEQARRLVRLAEEANACLENEGFRDGFELAEERLKQLEQELPESSFVHRNRVIARLLFYRQNKVDLQDDQEFIDTTDGLVEKLIENEPNSFEPYILAFRWRYEQANDITEAEIELLESAIQNAGSSPIPYYEFYDKTSILDDTDIPGIAAKRQDNLAKAYELQPENIRLSTLYLQQLAELKSDQFEVAWKQFLDRLSPLAVSADLEQFDNAQQQYVAKINDAVKAKDWIQILLGVRRLSNLIKRGEVLKIDLARVLPYELEFLKFELEPDVVAKAAIDKSPAKPVPAKFGSTAAIQSENPVTALRILDFNIDNALDIVTLSDNQLTVYEQSDGGKWNVTGRFPLPKKYSGFLAADLDYDKRTVVAQKKDNAKKEATFSSNYSDPDFVLYGPSGIDVFENKLNPDGSRSLEKIQPGDLSSVASATMATLVDIDHDKDLDLIVAGDAGFKMFLSRGNLSFYDFTEHSVFPASDRKVISMDIVDFDRDIDIDVLIGFEDGSPGYLENLGHSQVRFRSFDESIKAAQNGRQCMAVEIDGRPSWDVLCSSPDGIIVSTTQTTQSSVSQVQSTRIGNATGSILAVADFNNDGFLDSLCTGNDAEDKKAKIVLGDGVAITAEPCLIEKKIEIADAADLDGDGKVDVVGVSGDGKFLDVWTNTTDTDNQWIEISVCGRDSNFPKGRINNHAIGSFVELKAGDHYFATTVKQPQLHFGLGKNKDIDLIRFLWTSGMPQSLFKIKSGQSIYEEMFEKGSCPYIYTWDGQKFTFFSDCLWAAPLGLQYAPGKFIPCRNWEYLKIPGELLKPKDGQYVLQITEELREAAYFDLVRLYAVDHPKDVDIFTNEKVGPGFIAEPKIHTVVNPRLPVSASDMQGNDVLPLIAATDGKYYRGFEKRIGKGLAPPHYLELDFGDLKKEFAEASSGDKFTLFLNGWIRPTDCSLNISYAQNPEEPSPKTPVVLVPNKKGEWTKMIDPMGFPGGKPKTIAVDLTDAFLCDDYRIRIQTSHEIYWDQAFFTFGEKPVEIKQTELNPVAADLHYRGFSKRYTNGPDSPEVYDYETVNQTPRWPAMTGKFTRYGDVSQLLTERDDCSAVIGAGDEMTVTFEALPDPPEGWERDFVIHLVGYDKDGDLNTVTGQSSEPLPFEGMKSYPWSLDESFPTTPKHDEYLRTYQTRTQSWGSFWKRVVPTDSE